MRTARRGSTLGRRRDRRLELGIREDGDLYLVLSDDRRIDGESRAR